MFLERLASTRADTDVIFYTDNCGGQQRNRFIIGMYLYAVEKFQVKSITHKYLIRGHTQNEGDTVYSIIEKSLKKAKKSGPIYVPHQYVSIIRSAKKKGSPFIVREMSFGDFMDLKLLSDEMAFNYSKNINGGQIRMPDIKMLRFEKGNDSYYKTSYDDDVSWQAVQIRTISRRSSGVWGKMQLRRKEQTRKLTQPIVTELENEVRANLADLRSMVSRDYAAILMGIDDAKEFHHMNNKNADSLSDKDRRLFETTIFMVTKVVWIALFRKHLSLIEKEVNRLLRTLNFSPIEHSQKSLPSSTPQEDRVLFGKAFRIEKRLLHRSPAIQEIIFDDHDYRLLSIGINNIPNADERIRYLEIAYAAPETLLVDNDIAVGVLGVRRKYLDPMLKPKDISTTVKRTSLMKIGNFKLPPKSPLKDKLISDVLPSTPCRYQETRMTAEVRATQCKMWRKYLQMGGVLLSELEEAESVRTLRTSICPSRTNI